MLEMLGAIVALIFKGVFIMALLPPVFLDAVVAIGFGDDPAKRQWIGTGFLFGKVVDPSIEESKRQYKIWLITNRHVLEGLKSIYIKFNSIQNTASKDYKVELIARNGKPRWIGHQNTNIDVASIIINPAFLKTEQRKFSFFRSELNTMKYAEIINNQITEGDRIFVLGFPMGLVAPDQQYVICRGGYLARIRDFKDKKSIDFIIDATVFPGNSGGPVIICPSAIAIQGTKPILKADLIGIVKSYVPYQDVALSQQTRRPRIVFEENTGLAIVESVDSILETIELAEKRLKGRIAQVKSKEKKKLIQNNKNNATTAPNKA